MEQNKDKTPSKLNQPLSDLFPRSNIATRALKALSNLGIHTVNELLAADLSILFSTEGIGQGTTAFLEQQKEQLVQQLVSENLIEESDIGQKNLSDYMNSPLIILSLTVVEREALAQAGLKTIMDFANANLHLLGNSKNIGIMKIQKLQKLQLTVRQKIRTASGNTQIFPEPLAVDELLMSQPMCSLHLATRTINILKRNRIETVGQFILCQPQMFRHQKSVGEATWTEIYDLHQKLTQMKGESLGIDTVSVSPEADIEKWKQPFDEEVLLTLPFYNDVYKGTFDIEDFDQTWFPLLGIDELVLPNRLKKACALKKLQYLGELLLTPSSEFNHLAGKPDILGMAQKTICSFLTKQLKETYAPDFSSPTNFYAGILYYTQDDKNQELETGTMIDFDRHMRIVIDRSSGKTLKEIGEVFSITRERVRQLEHIFWVRVYRFRFQLSCISNVLVDILNEFGGFSKIEDLYKHLAEKLSWTYENARYFTDNFIEVYSGLFQKHPYDYVSLDQYKCHQCPILKELLWDLAEEIADGTTVYTIEEFVDIVRKAANSECSGCPHPVPSRLPYALFEWFFRQRKEYQSLKRLDTIGRAISTTINDAVIYTLEQSPVPMTIPEIIANIQKLASDRFEGLDQIRGTIQHLTKSGEIVLWNRGGGIGGARSTFVHRKNVHTDYPILGRIERELLDMGKNSAVPQIRLNVIFKKFKKECQMIGIETVYALHSLLRLRNKRGIIYLRSPYVGFGGNDHKISNVTLFEEYVIAQKRIISTKELIQFGKQLGLEHGHVQNTIALTNLLRTRGGYCHVDNFDFQGKPFQNIIRNLQMKIETEGHISTRVIFKTCEQECVELGIVDDRMLFGLLTQACSGQYNFCYPSISSLQMPRIPNRRHTLRAMILQFLIQQNKPVSFEQLHAHFVVQRGYEKQTLETLLSTPEVIRCNTKMYIHASVMNWGNEDQDSLLALVKEFWTRTFNEGTPYARLEDFLAQYEPRLPKLPKELKWNQILLCDMLKKRSAGMVFFFGNTQNCYSINSEESTLRTFGDFVEYLLRRHFKGRTTAVKFTQFVRSEVHAIQKALPKKVMQKCSNLVLKSGAISVSKK